MILKLSRRSSIALVILMAALSISVGFVASAQVVDDPFANINYPIAELGGCEDRDACESYCNTLLHIDECISYADRNGLLSAEEIAEARTFAKLGSSGPGGCENRVECDRFCSDINNIKECIAFGEKHGLIDDEHIGEARKVLSAIESGAKLPGGCSSKESCEAYCEDGAHISECVAFAEAAGLISAEELVEIRKFEEVLKSGNTPGNCQGRSQCEAYCKDDSHLDECISFAERSGVASAEDIERFKKTGGKGPGGCRGRVECEAFCNDPSNQQACFKFANEHDLLGGEDKERLNSGVNRIRDGLSKATPEVLTCLEGKLGADIVAKMKSGDFFPSPRVGEAMRGCFDRLSGRDEHEGDGFERDSDRRRPSSRNERGFDGNNNADAGFEDEQSRNEFTGDRFENFKENTDGFSIPPRDSSREELEKFLNEHNDLVPEIRDEIKSQIVDSFRREDDFNGEFRREDSFREEHFDDFRGDFDDRNNFDNFKKDDDFNGDLYRDFRQEGSFEQSSFVKPEDAVFRNDTNHLESNDSFKRDFPDGRDDSNPTSFDQSSPSTSSFDSEGNTIDVFINEEHSSEESFNDSSASQSELQSKVKRNAFFANVSSLLEGLSR